MSMQMNRIEHVKTLCASGATLSQCSYDVNDTQTKALIIVTNIELL